MGKGVFDGASRAFYPRALLLLVPVISFPALLFVLSNSIGELISPGSIQAPVYVAEPLAAWLPRLLIAAVHTLWGLPLVMGNWEGEGLLWAVMLSRFVGLALIHLYLMAIYNLSGGSVLLPVLFHGCFSSMLILMVSPVAYPIAILLVIALIVRFRLWRRESVHVPVFFRP